MMVTNTFIHNVACWHSAMVRFVILAARYMQRNENPHARVSAVEPLYRYPYDWNTAMLTMMKNASIHHTRYFPSFWFKAVTSLYNSQR